LRKFEYDWRLRKGLKIDNQNGRVKRQILI
jgi:hypothetical protein